MTNKPDVMFRELGLDWDALADDSKALFEHALGELNGDYKIKDLKRNMVGAIMTEVAAVLFAMKEKGWLKLPS